MNSQCSRSYYAAPADEFCESSTETILGAIALSNAFELDILQRNAWMYQIVHLKSLVNSLPGSFLFLEFSIPRMGKRADAIVLYENIVFILEYKVGSTSYDGTSTDQVLDYAVDLKNFHEASHLATIVPILIATKAVEHEHLLSHWSDGVFSPILTNEKGALSSILDIVKLLQSSARDPLPSPLTWASSRYKPTPTIVQAAQALYRGHDVREISRSEAGAENLSTTTDYVNKVIEDSKREGRKTICILTGVPGSGKTLAGLSLANERMDAHEDEHAVFLSGNGPLVDVLREALARDEVERMREKKTPVRRADAERRAKAFIQNIHHFRDEYLNGQVPIEKVVVFDEAQRAWTREQASKFMSTKRNQTDFDQSEPSFLLSVMDRHQDWCVVVCLIGGGQEINTGEAGLAEWLDAIQSEFRHWTIHLSNQLSSTDYLGQSGSNSEVLERATKTPALHLAISVRSFRAEVLSDFVAAILDGNTQVATALIKKLEDFPLVVTRDLEQARSWLRSKARGTERTGLVASANALRLKPMGIHVKSAIDPPMWFLSPKDDVRSSYALEDAGTEFDVQGLELDWVGVCWDANLRHENGKWRGYRFHGTSWQSVSNTTRLAYLLNSYRVLLTRGRQGMVIIVPKGDETDITRIPSFYDGAYKLLINCGISPL